MTTSCGRDEHASVMRSRNLFLGVTLIVVGVLWMMNNLELLSDSLFDVVFSWQMLLVLIGGYLLALRKWLAGGIVAARRAVPAADRSAPIGIFL